MASSNWGTDTALSDLMFRDSWGFSFFQAVKLLAYIYPEKMEVGATALPNTELVRFRAHPSLQFPASEICAIRPDGDGPATMTVAFMGLTGPKGALPGYYTDTVIEQEMSGSKALTDFLDLFNHRLISLFYRAWEKHHFIPGYERGLRRQKEDEFTGHLMALIGMGTGGLRGRLLTRDQALLRYAGLIAQRPHSASALSGLLRDYFGVPAEVEQFCGRWHPLEEQELSYLETEGVHNQLGVGAVAGDAVWNQQAIFKVRFGPLTLQRFREFLPDGAAFRKAVDLVRYFADRALEFEIQLVLMAAEVPWLELTGDGPESPRLGWSGWLKTEAFQNDAADPVFAGVMDDQFQPEGRIQ